MTRRIPRSRFAPLPDTSQLLRIESAQLDGTCAISLVGEVDLSTADVLRAGLLAGIEKAGSRIVVDLHRLLFIDSTGIRVLAHASEHAARSGKRLVVQRPSATIRRVLGIAGLDDLVAEPVD